MSHTLMLNALVGAGWKTPSQLAEMSTNDWRNTLIVELANRTADVEGSINQKLDEQLAYHALICHWLYTAEIRTEEQLKTMSLEDQRNTVIVESQNRSAGGGGGMDQKSNWELLTIAYQWWLPIALGPLIDSMNHIDTANTKAFGLKDNEGNSMDCLKILKMSEASYLGIYHTNRGDGRFDLHIGESNGDLSTWNKIVQIGSRSHQGEIQKMGNGFVVLNEESDLSIERNHIRVRYYNDRESLFRNEPSHDVPLERKFSEDLENGTNNGTPSIISIEGDSPENSSIFMGFHYYKDLQVDRQAYGVLKNFDGSEWTAWKNEIANRSVKALGFAGNIGGRQMFEWDDRKLTVLEARVNNDWNTWMLLVGNGMFFTKLRPQTLCGASAFANPGVAKVSDHKYVATCFIPNEAAGRCAANEMLYTFEVSNQ